MEILSKLYLELSNILSADVVSSREIRLKKQIDDYGLTLLMISNGAEDYKNLAKNALDRYLNRAY